MQYNDTIDLHVFEGETTYKNDYRILPQEERKFFKWPKDKFETLSKPPDKYIHECHSTFQRRKGGTYIPMDLLWDPNPITRHNPHEAICMPEQPVDMAKEEAIRTRPRLYTSPAVSIDDIPDKETRQLLCDFMYTTDWRKAEREAAVNRFTVKEIPNTVVEPPRDPVRFTPDLWPPLPAGWREMAKEWDSQQSRACVDPTKNFWVYRDPPLNIDPGVNPLAKLVPTEIKEEISGLLKTNQLRLPHDKPMQGYTGYKPVIAKGCTLKQNEFPVTHPLLTVSQTISRRHAQPDQLVYQGREDEQKISRT